MVKLLFILINLYKNEDEIWIFLCFEQFFTQTKMRLKITFIL